MPFASALSEHPTATEAVGECCGALLDALGPHPDLVVAFPSTHHAPAAAEIAGALVAALSPMVLVGAVADSVVGTGREVEGSPALSVWAGRFGPVVPVHVTARMDPDRGLVWSGIPASLPSGTTALVLIADPWTFPAEEFLAYMRSVRPGLPVIGGMASGARAAGETRLLWCTDRPEVHTNGAVGVLVGPGVELRTVVSQGCRPIGRPLVVTACDGRVVSELAGRPALVRLQEVAAKLTQEEIGIINRTEVHLGRVIDEHKESFGHGDFLIRTVVGADRSTGAIVVNDVLEVGTTVQFHLRDAAAADEDLRLLIGSVAGERPIALGRRGALMFTCNGRGRHMFGTPDHDAGVLADLLGPVPVAGFFAQGELGPVGGRNFLHGFTASLALLDELVQEPVTTTVWDDR